ncbi:hypothetical protein C3432_08845 [Citrobacter amalonaticus]|uniref:Uncharacterized protein n=1 Tax=Citrobacter amalonaticus TaxID=35703 RepID=A0A2S4RZC1_CITAM|nr:hypothetical protein C3432_08845 [Citrobacter amalonaticus]POT76456.1 hypothetical protein C3436_02980 [Citrobacter amalonaticus]POU66545.1 hypothetical protein C3430_07045 [Citrobacter amalonaticus]POV05691.1 hypothetical protein C3424_10285 [Citrobacter amalonaticus]
MSRAVFVALTLAPGSRVLVTASNHFGDMKNPPYGADFFCLKSVGIVDHIKHLCRHPAQAVTLIGSGKSRYPDGCSPLSVI